MRPHKVLNSKAGRVVAVPSGATVRWSVGLAVTNMFTAVDSDYIIAELGVTSTANNGVANSGIIKFGISTDDDKLIRAAKVPQASVLGDKHSTRYGAQVSTNRFEFYASTAYDAAGEARLLRGQTLTVTVAAEGASTGFGMPFAVVIPDPHLTDDFT